MNKTLVAFFLTLVAVSGLAMTVYAIERQSGEYAHPIFSNTGKTAQGISIQIGTSSPGAIWQSSGTTSHFTNYDTPVRRITIQNYQSFNLYCSTSSTGFTATTGPRWIVLSSTTYTTDNTSDIYCIFDSAAGGAKEVIGRIEYESRD